MTVGVMLVGLGQICMGYDLELDATRFVYSHARAFSQHPGFELLGGVDSDPDRCNVFSRVYRRSAFPDLPLALSEMAPELVVIGVPTEDHAAVLVQTLDVHRPAVILCEKPLSNDIDEAREIVNLCTDKGVDLYVNYIRRSDPGVVDVWRRIRTGELCGPLKGNVWYSKGLFHNGSHFINLLEFWLGSLVDSMILEEGRRWDGEDPEPGLFLRFRNGCVTMQAAWEEAFSHYTVELLSPNGRLRYEAGGQQILWQGVIADPYLVGYQSLSFTPTAIESGMNRYQYHVTEQLARAMTGQEANLCSGVEALGTLESIRRIVGQL